MYKKQNKELQTELVYGVHPIMELLRAKRRKILVLYTTSPEPKAWGQMRSLLPDYVRVTYTTRHALTTLAGTSDHQGFVARATPFPFRKKSFDSSKQPFILLLDGIQDIRNLGAIIRSAYCTGVNGVIVTQKNSAALEAAALKASAGLAEHLEIMQVPTAKIAATELRAAGYHLYLATVDKGERASDVSFQRPLCLVIGGEGFGISSDILSSGTRITLPQRTGDISYNASVAAGIVLFLIATQHKSI